MAAVGCTEDNSSMDSEDKTENGSLNIAEICKKNGVNHSLNSAPVLDAKATKSKKVVRINGTGKFSIATPSIPSLRSRRDRLVPDLWKKTKKVTVVDSKDGYVSLVLCLSSNILFPRFSQFVPNTWLTTYIYFLLQMFALFKQYG